MKEHSKRRAPGKPCLSGEINKDLCRLRSYSLFINTISISIVIITILIVIITIINDFIGVCIQTLRSKADPSLCHFEAGPRDRPTGA